MAGAERRDRGDVRRSVAHRHRILRAACLAVALLAARPAVAAGPQVADVRAVGLPEAKGIVTAVTVRVTGLGCGAVQAGSGVTSAAGRTLTSGHVVEGASMARVDAGRRSVLAEPAVGVGLDLAVLPAQGPAVQVRVAATDPVPGATVTVGGYPVGRPLRVAAGEVVDYVDGTARGQGGRLVRIDAPVDAGMSGGPVVDGNGRLAGVLVAHEEVSGYALAVPASSLRAVLDDGGFVLARGCEPVAR